MQQPSTALLRHLESCRVQLEHNLARHLEQQLPRHSFAEIYRYSVLPPGKLVRPMMVVAIHNDFSLSRQHTKVCEPENLFNLEKFCVNSSLNHLCSAIEIHHAYTLVHDDLPCMDNDELRRGKPTVHKAFGEWPALLAGDALLNASYAIWAQIQTPHLNKLIQFITWAVGPRGLIHGQVLDLLAERNNVDQSLSMEAKFLAIYRTDQLKTARLFQVAMIGSYLLTREENPDSSTLVQLFHLGNAFGITFQILDDLQDWIEQADNVHEHSINMFSQCPQQALSCLQDNLDLMKNVVLQQRMHSFAALTHNYLWTIYKKIESLEKINSNIANTSQLLSKVRVLLQCLDLGQ